MGFTTRRGRPAKVRERADTGTPELVMKRSLGLTEETIDECLRRGIIDADQHWCAIHLRWLYTLRYGAPGVRAIDTTHLGGTELSPDNPEWYLEREREFNEALAVLQPSRCTAALMALTIHNERPAFLIYNPTSPRCLSSADLVKREKDIARLRYALDLLALHWGRRRKS